MTKVKLVKILLSVLGILMISATVYVAWKINKEIEKTTSGLECSLPVQKTQKENGISEKEALTKETETLKPKISTSDWKTYRNDQYGYEIKYPGNWGVSALPLEEGKPLKIVDLSLNFKNDCYILIWALPVRVGYGLNLEPNSQEQITINGLKGQKIIFKDQDTVSNEVMVYLKEGNRYYTIEYPLDEKKICSTALEGILSSFRSTL